MKLIIAIVQSEDEGILSDTLMEEGFSVTKLNTVGGFLKKHNRTLLISTADDTVDLVLDIIKSTAKSREEITPVPIFSSIPEANFSTPTLKVNVGGASVFVIDVEKFIKY